MNPTTTTETGMAIVARQSPMKPKPTKREILKATAIALHSEDCKCRKEAEAALKREKVMRLEALLPVIGRHIQAAGVEFNSWSGKLEICPKDSQPPELREALIGFKKWHHEADDKLPKIRPVTDLLKELQEATCDGDQRIYSILSDEATRKSLIEEGTRLLGGGN